jgi:hypothetical protein
MALDVVDDEALQGNSRIVDVPRAQGEGEGA